jgi:Na+/H+ antiporter NhaD/arsenite permease-like protein
LPIACKVVAGALALMVSAPVRAAEGPAVLGVPVDFILFALKLLGVALFHRHTLYVALAGLAVITAYKLGFTGFKTGSGISGFLGHFLHEWVILANLLCLLLGFALLSRHFEKTQIPAVLPRFLPDDWKGCFALLAIVFVLSSFLDNIAAALIGGAMAHTLFRARVHIGYLAAIVAASNAGGSGSVIGDTTTTMMWIDGVSPWDVAEAALPAAIALVVFGIPAAIQQQRYSPILKRERQHVRVDWIRLGIVFFVLAVAIAANVAMNLGYVDAAHRFPFIGAAVVAALLASTPLRRPDWEVLPESFKGSIFLLSLVLSATMMPVEKLPPASWQTSMGLGFVSAVFDNIPLTALALRQGGYDWGYLAYAVGFGGSMIWFGSSAGVALSNMYPEAKSVGRWVYHGWPVALAYVIGFFALLFVLGWHPNAPHKARAAALEPPPASAAAVPVDRSFPPCTRGSLAAVAGVHGGFHNAGRTRTRLAFETA